jgi:NAD(P)-dependent dehydrogenase (short-subunit alcohol dehydrogenase family)
MLEPSISVFSLVGRKALVTGASRGIGQALAVGLARFGADVAICSRTEAALERCTDAIEAAGRKAVPFALDVRETDRIQPAIDEAAAGLGGLDILINNAGIEQVSPSLEVDEALWDRIVDTNLKGAFFCAQAAARRMAQGAIVNVCSLTSGVGVPTAVPYGSSKSGLLGMTRALAAEWAPAIRVNAIGPAIFAPTSPRFFTKARPGAPRCWKKSPQAGSATSTTWSAPPCSCAPTPRATSPANCCISTAATWRRSDARVSANGACSSAARRPRE